jgi:hypothetical protein
VGKSGETFDDVQLQQLSDDANGTIESDIKVNLLPLSTTARISSLFNFNRFQNSESSEDDMNNEIESVEVIEIEVPLIGSDFMRRHYDNVESKASDNFDNTERYAEIDILPTQATTDFYTSSDNALTFSKDFQASPTHATTYKNTVETTTQSDVVETSTPTTKSVYDESRIIDSRSIEVRTDDIQSVESKLMEQWKAADNMIDDLLESEVLTTLKPRFHPKFPFNVKIMVNNDEERKSCKSKTSCSQVRFARSKQHDIDPQFYADYSDEDLFFQSVPDRYYDRPNELRPRNARRAADDMITPAPRFPTFPQGRVPLKKPAFIERLENESSLERSERVNKNLDNLMRFISVWAQVDKFVSDRARGAIKKIAYLTGDDYDDNILGTKRRVDRSESNKRAVVEPFT